jgi:hypothetical protein
VTGSGGCRTWPRQAASVASVLGFRFSFEQVSAMLGLSPAVLLGPVEELLRADLLVESSGQLMFRHELIREAVSETLPDSARAPLRRQAAEVLLSSGAPPLEVARLLLDSAQPGDQIAIDALHQAAKQLGPVDPATASELSMKALSLTAPGSPNRLPLVEETAILLHAAGHETRGKQFADAALRDGLSPDQEAEVRLTIAAMYRLSPEVRVQTGLVALSLPGVSELMRARHRGRLVVNLAAAGRVAQAREMADQADRAVRSTGDAVACADLAVGNLVLDQLDGHYAGLLASKLATDRLVARDGQEPAIPAAESFGSLALAGLDRSMRRSTSSPQGWPPRSEATKRGWWSGGRCCEGTIYCRPED